MFIAVSSSILDHRLGGAARRHPHRTGPSPSAGRPAPSSRARGHFVCRTQRLLHRRCASPVAPTKTSETSDWRRGWTAACVRQQLLDSGRAPMLLGARVLTWRRLAICNPEHVLAGFALWLLVMALAMLLPAGSPGSRPAAPFSRRRSAAQLLARRAPRQRAYPTVLSNTPTGDRVLR